MGSSELLGSLEEGFKPESRRVSGAPTNVFCLVLR